MMLEKGGEERRQDRGVSLQGGGGHPDCSGSLQ